MADNFHDWYLEHQRMQPMNKPKTTDVGTAQHAESRPYTTPNMATALMVEAANKHANIAAPNAARILSGSITDKEGKLRSELANSETAQTLQNNLTAFTQGKFSKLGDPLIALPPGEVAGVPVDFALGNTLSGKRKVANALRTWRRRILLERIDILDVLKFRRSEGIWDDQGNKRDLDHGKQSSALSPKTARDTGRMMGAYEARTYALTERKDARNRTQFMHRVIEERQKHYQSLNDTAEANKSQLLQFYGIGGTDAELAQDIASLKGSSKKVALDGHLNDLAEQPSDESGPGGENFKDLRNSLTNEAEPDRNLKTLQAIQKQLNNIDVQKQEAREEANKFYAAQAEPDYAAGKLGEAHYNELLRRLGYDAATAMRIKVATEKKNFTLTTDGDIVDLSQDEVINQLKKVGKASIAHVDIEKFTDQRTGNTGYTISTPPDFSYFFLQRPFRHSREEKAIKNCLAAIFATDPNTDIIKIDGGPRRIQKATWLEAHRIAFTLGRLDDHGKPLTKNAITGKDCPEFEVQGFHPTDGDLRLLETMFENLRNEKQSAYVSTIRQDLTQEWLDEKSKMYPNASRWFYEKDRRGDPHKDSGLALFNQWLQENGHDPNAEDTAKNMDTHLKNWFQNPEYPDMPSAAQQSLAKYDSKFEATYQEEWLDSMQRKTDITRPGIDDWFKAEGITDWETNETYKDKPKTPALLDDWWKNAGEKQYEEWLRVKDERAYDQYQSDKSSSPPSIQVIPRAQ